MRSQVYRQGRYAAQQEMCLHHFHQLLDGGDAAAPGDAGTPSAGARRQEVTR